MQFLLCLAALVACACAQVSISPERLKTLPHPYFSKKMLRQPRDTTWQRKVGENGNVFGTLGQDNSGLFGKAGYDHQIFNDDRGKLNAQAYGSRVLGPNGDSTNFGGKLDWANKNAKAALDLSRPVGGHTGLRATGEGAWNLDKNTHISAGGFYDQPILGHGRPDYGVQAQFKKDF